jgi:hypothetical protein
MLTFDEFFKKKRVDLIALEKAEPALFSEFKIHYEQMGEKSFDHTKKYWFNKSRRQYPLAPEVKTEKPQIANPIAEQTITESLTATVPATPSSPKVGFTPKFRAANMAKPVVEDKKEESPAATGEPVAPPAEVAPAKPAGFVPRFKMKPKADAEESTSPPASAETPQPIETTEAKPAYVPKFKMKPKADTEESATLPPATTNEAPAITEPVAEKKPAYKPRFVPPKPKE